MADLFTVGKNKQPAGKSGKFDLLDQEMLAAQLVAIMDAHLERPDTEQKLRILDLARQQVSI